MTPPPMASAPRRSGGPSSPVPEGRSCGSAPRSAAGAWGDNPVSRCRSCSGAKGPGTSACAFPMVLSLSTRSHGRPRRRWTCHKRCTLKVDRARSCYWGPSTTHGVLGWQNSARRRRFVNTNASKNVFATTDRSYAAMKEPPRTLPTRL